MRQLSEIERTDELQALISLLATRSGQSLVGNALSRELEMSARTVHRYLTLLQQVFLIKRLPAWRRKLGDRAVATPQVAFVDSGLAAHLLRIDALDLIRPNTVFGLLLRGFVLMELARQLTWADEPVELYHYRTRDRIKVDAVLESRRG